MAQNIFRNKDGIIVVHGTIGTRLYGEDYTFAEAKRDYESEAFARDFDRYCGNGNRYGRTL